jgi:hypothetical protein
LESARRRRDPNVGGFRLNAELLAAHVRENRGARDTLIFPFVYSWRQHIELALKQVIVEAEQLYDIDGDTPVGHDLNELWERFRRCVQSGATEEEFSNAEHVIGELHAIDPIGEAFRYGTSKDGTATVPTIEQLSFERVGSACAALSNFLDAAATQISLELEAKHDALAEQLYVEW